jgi:hypothetical protein
MPGGTNLPVLGDLGRGSQTPYPYDAYPPEWTYLSPCQCERSEFGRVQAYRGNRISELRMAL